MLRVTVEIDDEAFGKCNIERKGAMVAVAPVDMTADELIQLVLDPDTDLDQYSTVVRIEQHHGVCIGEDEIERVAKRINHRQSKPRYSRRG